MIDGSFNFVGFSTKKQTKDEVTLSFDKGFTHFSKYLLQSKNFIVSFLARKKDNNYFEEVFNKERLGEKYSFSSSLSLLRNNLFRDRAASQGFIFIVYDEELNEISIVRDTFGTVPLYYCCSRAGFSFSTDAKYLLRQSEFRASSQKNINRIANYLTPRSDSWPCQQDSFYTNINSVLPGHFVHYSQGEILSEPFVSFQPQKWKHISNLEEYGEEFRHIFKESVFNNIRHHDNVSSHLSGGLDSSSVSSMIHYLLPELKFNTLYADTNTELTNESHYAKKVATFINSDHYAVHPSTNELDLLIKNTSLYGFPEQMALTPSLQTELIIKASKLGSSILMTGTDGDSVVGHGYHYLDQLFDEKRWADLKLAISERASVSSGLSTTKNWNYFTKSQKERLLFLHLFYPRVSHARSVHQALEVVNIAKSKFGIPYHELLRKGLNGIQNRFKYFDLLPASIQSSQLIAQTVSTPRTTERTALMKTLPEVYSLPIKEVYFNQGMAGNEENFYLARDNNIELGNPFYDTKLYELSMSVPDSMKYNHGKSRGHLREAMKGILIDDVRNRSDKGIFNEYAKNAAHRLYSSSKDFLSDTSEVWNYVDKAKFKQCVKLFESDLHPLYVHNRTTFFINRTIYLSIWLNQQI